MPAAPRAACERQPCRYFRPCPVHGAPPPQPGHSRAYGTHHRKLRERVLREEPICPGYGKWLGRCGRRTAHMDHIKALRAGGRTERSNLRGLCARCHGVKTVTVDGGYGNAKKPPPDPRGQIT